MKNRVEVDILGNKYSLKTDSDPKHVYELADFLNNKIKQITNGSQSASSQDIAILAALNVTDELFKLKDNVEDKYNKIVERTNQLVEHINLQL